MIEWVCPECSGSLVVLVDVTVYVRLDKHGRSTTVDAKMQHVKREALAQAPSANDVVCQSCGWMGFKDELLALREER